MNRKLIMRIIIDIGMTGCLLFLMPYSLLSETAHEWIGMAMFVLFITHHILNRRWIAVIPKGKYTLLRTIQTLLVVILFFLMLGSMVSGILLSNYIFKAVRIIGISMEARQVHIFCAYWGFALMSVHLGMHWEMVVNMVSRLFHKSSMIRDWAFRLIAIIIADYGVYEFRNRQIGDYLMMKMHFVFYDYTETAGKFMIDYMAVMVLIAFCSYYITFMLKRGQQRRIKR